MRIVLLRSRIMSKRSRQSLEHSEERLIPSTVYELRKKHYSRATIKAYTHWIKRYIRYHNYVQPSELGAKDIESFLSSLAVNRNVSSSTQNQALNAIVFLYRRVIQSEIGEFNQFSRAKSRIRVPVVFEPEEIVRIFANLEGVYLLIANLIYGSGLRVRECFKLRIKDIDFVNGQLTIRDSKGSSDRITILSKQVTPCLCKHLERVKELHLKDLSRGFGRAPVPYSLARKYPAIDKSLSWQFVFPSKRITKNEPSGLPCRHHMSETGFQRAFKGAMTQAGILKHASCHKKP